MHARAGHVSAPALAVAANLGEIGGEDLARKPPLAHVRHLILDARLVPRVPDPSRVGEDVPRIRVVVEGAIQRRIGLTGAHHHRRGVVEDDVLGHAAEKSPRSVQPRAHVLHGLRERRPDVHVPAR
jgi:hypothetical protein